MDHLPAQMFVYGVVIGLIGGVFIGAMALSIK